jgi:PIN domain nuclease of toxin-antitoxin system
MAAARELTVTYEHALAVQSLPLHHEDPFDRLLVAQARCEGLALATADQAIRAYEVVVCWVAV